MKNKYLFNEAPIQVPSPMLIVTVQGPRVAKENWHKKGIYLEKRKRISKLTSNSMLIVLILL